MKVFRVECPECFCGPYSPHYACNSDTTIGDILGRIHNDVSHPSPTKDGIPRGIAYSPHFFCATESFEALYEWFGIEWLYKLHLGGFVVAEYNVPPSHVHFGRFQVMFDPSYATRTVRKCFKAPLSA